MKILKFTLSGKTAFFKKPDVNSYLYFTYGNIHKMSLIGIFGAILGYGGYNQMSLSKELNKKDKKANKQTVFPEFYSKLIEIKISIAPNNEKGFIPKKVQTFNNSVGYASKEQGGNLIIKEQWLENPSWDIYILINSQESERIAHYLMESKCVYQPYLGKNDHIADITNVEVFDDSEIKEVSQFSEINCLCPKNSFAIGEEDDGDDTDLPFKYEEQLPVGLNPDTYMYNLEAFIYTNMNLVKNEDIDVYKIRGNNIVFY